MYKRIIFRLPDQLYEQTQQAVKDGKAETVSKLTREALKKYLKE